MMPQITIKHCNSHLCINNTVFPEPKAHYTHNQQQKELFQQFSNIIHSTEDIWEELQKAQ